MSAYNVGSTGDGSKWGVRISIEKKVSEKKLQCLIVADSFVVAIDELRTADFVSAGLENLFLGSMSLHVNAPSLVVQSDGQKIGT